jgi:hypothetical protein
MATMKGKLATSGSCVLSIPTFALEKTYPWGGIRLLVSLPHTANWPDEVRATDVKARALTSVKVPVGGA